MGIEGIIMRPHGQIYITGGTENAHLHKAKYFDGKRFAYHGAYLSKPEAEGHADATRVQGYLARVIPRKVWINRAGYAFGMEQVQGYVLYVHYGERNLRKHMSEKSALKFGGENNIEDDGGESRYLEGMDRADRNYQTEW